MWQLVLNLDQYRANMLKFGRQNGDLMLTYAAEEAGSGPALNHTYYDAALVYDQIAEETGDRAAWQPVIDAALTIFRDTYVLGWTGGKIAPWYSFTDGLLRHYRRTGDERSKQAVLAIAYQAPYHRDDTPEEATVDASICREVAYAIVAMLNAELLGEPRRLRLWLLLDHALGHLDQLYRQRTSDMCPFMGGLTAYALARFHDQIAKDARIVPAMNLVSDVHWKECWRDAQQGFFYRASAGTTEGAPDLNMLVLPIDAFLYREIGEAKYLRRAEATFNGGVAGAWLHGGKQFNQSYQRSFEALAWLGAVPTPIPVPTPMTLLELDTKYGFFADPGGYYTNHRGQNEKYIRGTASANGYPTGNPSPWYYLLPNGDLYEFTPPYTNQALAGVMVESVGTAVYDDPRLLFEVNSPTPDETLKERVTALEGKFDAMKEALG